MRPALFLDRDGVINEEVGFLHRPEEVRFVPGIFELIRQARSRDYAIIVITNQSGIGRGLYSEEQFQALMRHMRSLLAAEDADVDAVYFSPFHPVHGLNEYKRDTDCRKPGPGMLLQAAREYDLDLSRSALIGDRCSDLAAGAAAGVPLLILLDGTEVSPCEQENLSKYLRAQSLEVAAFQLGFQSAPPTSSTIT
ncbi:D-glycero-alpha-D-manno-heptose-1,7-bisphosphate 7-phosphatase [Terriglobus saanensis]|uniref:D,D-heptose 1,7-bisphosphate phosphatase n=1 Tax=Terriglobus saanensis (strain ATCC BAA-1853 / DSM 23119 / SP1PR4) TaxID=401053 RepID=E8UYQ7_TERSS|nr:HAD family hydrolase [Terriglobus saanensis]ADV84273.1 D,D-heptose 1,7-bisphosphate phosphatase [Terriglobus saanensis SP1PR4]